MTEEKALLVIHPGALGDVVLSFPALERLAACFSSVHLICQGQIGKVAERLGVAERSFPLESAVFTGLYGSPSARFSAWVAGYDPILVFSVSSELTEHLKRQGSASVYRVSPRPEPNLRIHVTDHLVREITKSGLIDAHGCKNPWLSGVEFEDRRCKEADGGRVLIHPGAGSPKKRWPVEYFFELARRLQEEGLSPRFLLGPAETDLADLIRRENKPLLVTEDAGSLLDHLQHAGALVGNDSGVSHLAAFTGLPTVAVFGPSDPARWAPKGRAAIAVFAGSVDCAPCFETRAEKCRQRRCLEAVSVKMVIDALTGLLPPGRP